MVRGVRGATTIKANDQHEVIQATRELLTEMIDRNTVIPGDIASVLFTGTPDIILYNILNSFYFKPIRH